MARNSRTNDDFGLKKSSGVNYEQVLDRHVDDDRFERQRAIRAAATAPLPEKPKAVGVKAVPQSATMDAFMRMVTGKEERTIADRISDPNRPTWEQYKKDNADKLDLNGNGDKEMKEYRKKLDAAREKALNRRNSSSKKKKSKRSRSSSSSDDGSDSDSGGGRKRLSKKKSRKKKKSHKRRRAASSDSDASDVSSSEDDDDKRSSRKHGKKEKKRKAHKKKRKTKATDRERSSSPVRLSSFFQHGSDSDDNSVSS